MPPSKPIKERLNQKTCTYDLRMIRLSMYAYIARHDPQLKTLKFYDFHIENLLPYLQYYSPSWNSMTQMDFNVRHIFIRDVFHFVKNLFDSLDTLHNQVANFLLTNEQGEDFSEAQNSELDKIESVADIIQPQEIEVPSDIRMGIRKSIPQFSADRKMFAQQKIRYLT